MKRLFVFLSLLGSFSVSASELPKSLLCTVSGGHFLNVDGDFVKYVVKNNDVFVVDTKTGLMSGQVKNTYFDNYSINVVSTIESYKDTAYKVVSFDDGSNMFSLSVHTYSENKDKPFIFSSYDIVLHGTCSMMF